MFVYAGSRIQNAGEQFVSCIHPSVINFALYPTPETETELGLETQFSLGNHVVWYTCSCSFILIITDSVTYQCT